MTTPLEQFKNDSRNRIPIYYLWRSVWRFIFDEYSCGLNHQSEMQNEILKWNQVVQYQKKIRVESFGPDSIGKEQVGKNGNLIDEIEYNIMAMSSFLVKNEFGGFDRTKELLRIHRIDYKRYTLCKEWFPEVQPKDAKIKAEAALDENKKEFPELYPKFNKVTNRVEGIK